MSFSRKVVIVTGASSGIGASIAILFTREGANVVMVGRNETKLKNVAAKCEQNGGKPLVINADVSKDEDVKRIIKGTLDKYGQIDVLINNAGFARFGSILDENIMQTYDNIMSTNLRAVVHLTNLAAPHIIKTKGNIINISSVVSIKPFQRSTIYCTSKAGLDHFSRCVALELAPHGVRVNTVNPGPVKTDFVTNTGAFTPEQEAEFAKNVGDLTALNRCSEPDEIADVVLFLASDKAKSVTGSSYFADNGAALKG